MRIIIVTLLLFGLIIYHAEAQTQTIAGVNAGWQRDGADWVVTLGSLSANNRWNAIGLTSSGGMQGAAAIACTNFPANCQLLSLYRYGVNPDNSYSVPIVSSDATSVTFRVPYAVLADGRTDPSSTLQQALFAQGSFSGGSIRQHDNRAVTQIDPSSSGIAATTTTTAIPSLQTTAPGGIVPAPFITVAGVNAGWQLDSDYWYVTFSVTSSSRWNAVGFAESGMSGSAVACSNNPPSCFLLRLFSYGISDQTPLNIVSSNGNTVTTAVPLSSLTTTEGSQRALFAQGAFNSGNLQVHDQKATALIDPRTTSVTVPSSNLESVAWAIVGAVLFVWFVGGIVLQRIIKPNYSYRQQILLMALALLTIVLLPLVLAMLYGKASDDLLESHPYFRGMGHGASLLLVFTVVFVLRHVSIAKYIFRSSFERTAWPYHALIGVCLFIFTTIHGFGMISDAPSRVGDASGSNPPLYGFLAWLAMFCMIATAMMRFWFYTAFRMAHWLYILVFAFAIVHRKSLWMMLLPPLALLAIDYVCRVLTATFLGGKISSAHHDADSGMTWLKIKARSPKPAKAGDFYCIMIPTLYSGFSHPFSLVSSADGEVHFAIQSVGRWTKALAAASSSLVNASVILMGPYGSVAFSLERLHTLLIVVGGSGVTPAFAVLESLVKDGVKAYPKLEEVHVLWIARYPSFLAHGADLMENLAKKCKAVGLKVITLSLYCTNLKADIPPKALHYVAPNSPAAVPLESLMSSIPGRDESMERRGDGLGGDAEEMDDFSGLSGGGRPAHTPREVNDFGREEGKDASPLETTPPQVAKAQPGPPHGQCKDRYEYVQWNKGRPDIKTFIKKNAEGAIMGGHQTGVFGCGPDVLMEDLKRISQDMDSDSKKLLSFHFEKFMI